MALCATAPAFAADGDKVDTTGTYKASFYAYYDADKDGTSEWAPAPMGMDTGCIADGWAYDLTNKEITLGFTSFRVGSLTGAITEVGGDYVIDLTQDDDGYAVSAKLDASDYDNTTVPGTSLKGIPTTLSYSVLGTGMSQNMAVYLVIQNV